MGVFRELCLYEDSLSAPVLGRDFRATEAFERHNVGIFEYRLRRFDPDLVYVWNMDGMSKSLLFRVQNKGIPMVFDLHSKWLDQELFESDPWFKWWFENPSSWAKLRKRVFSALGLKKKKLRELPIAPASELDLSRSYLCSESLRKTLLSSGVTGVDALPVIYPFVDESLFRPKTKYKRSHRFMWAGLVSREKAPDLAIDAVELVRDRGVKIELDIFGMGEQLERKALRKKIEQKGLEDVVRMRGIRPGELKEHYENYDALLFTSRFEDPFPMTVLEAMTSKLPCIVANTGGIPEIVRDSTDAILFDRDDPASLAAAIEQFLTFEDGGSRMAQCCIQSLRAVNSFDRVRQHIESQVNDDQGTQD
jgi:glycosyltransferase involved in cell wall biosynthesis